MPIGCDNSSTSLFRYMRLSEQKPDMFVHKLKFILLPQLVATLNSYACSLPPLANVDWSTFPECFCQPCKSTTGEIVQKEGSNWLWGPDMAPTVSARLSRPCSGILVFVDACTCHSYSKLYYLCLLSSLIKLLPPLTPPPRPSRPPPNIHWPNINVFHEKNHKNW